MATSTIYTTLRPDKATQLSTLQLQLQQLRLQKEEIQSKNVTALQQSVSTLVWMEWHGQQPLQPPKCNTCKFSTVVSTLLLLLLFLHCGKKRMSFISMRGH